MKKKKKKKRANKTAISVVVYYNSLHQNLMFDLLVGAVSS